MQEPVKMLKVSPIGYFGTMNKLDIDSNNGNISAVLQLQFIINI